MHREGKERVSSEETWALVFVPTMCLILGDKTGASGAKIALGAHAHLVGDFVTGPRWWKEAAGREEELKGGSAPSKGPLGSGLSSSPPASFRVIFLYT